MPSLPRPSQFHVAAPGAPFCSFANTRSLRVLLAPSTDQTVNSILPAASAVGAMLRAVISVIWRVSSKRAPTSVRKMLPAKTSKRRRLSSPRVLVATTSTTCLPSLSPAVFQDQATFAAQAPSTGRSSTKISTFRTPAVLLSRLSRASTAIVMVSPTCWPSTSPLTRTLITSVETRPSTAHIASAFSAPPCPLRTVRHDPSAPCLPASQRAPRAISGSPSVWPASFSAYSVWPVASASLFARSRPQPPS